MSKLVINTKKNPREPIEIEIDGRVLTVGILNREAMKKIREYDAKAKGGDLSAVFDRLELLLGQHPTLEKINLGQAVEITRFIIDHLFSKPEDEEEAKEE